MRPSPRRLFRFSLWTGRTFETCISICSISTTRHLHFSMVRVSLCDMVSLAHSGIRTVNIRTVAQLSAEYMSLALAKVWTGTAKLPSERTMCDEHRRTIEKRGGYGKQVLVLQFAEFIGASLPRSLSDSWNAHDRVPTVLGWMVERGGCQVRWQASRRGTQRVTSLVCFRGEHD